MLTPEEIKAKLRITHPADRPALAKKLHNAPVAAKAEVDRLVAAASNKVAGLAAKVDNLTQKLAGAATFAASRERLTPQDLRNALNDLFATYNFSPAEELVGMIMNRENPFYIEDTALRVKVLQDLNSYVMPKLKTTEITGQVKHAHVITILRIGEDGHGVKEMARAPIIREISAEVHSE